MENKELSRLEKNELYSQKNGTMQIRRYDWGEIIKQEACIKKEERIACKFLGIAMPLSIVLRRDCVDQRVGLERSGDITW